MRGSGMVAGLACWVMTDGSAGNEVPCVGLAEALGLAPTIKRIRVRRPWRWLPPQFAHDPLHRLDPESDRLEPPWPEVLIGCGRQAVASSIAIRRRSGGRTFTVYIHNPTVDPTRFDVVVAPQHDRLSGPNVIATLGGLNRVTPAMMEAAKARFAPRVAALPRPLVAVLLGGDSKVHRMTRRVVRRLARQLVELARRDGAGLLVTPSRRTPPKQIETLRRALAGVPAQIWDGTGENPYLGFLALADAFVVTGDSVNMVSEAATTGKPVHVFELAGGSAKFRRFHTALRGRGATRPFQGRLEEWQYEPLDDTARTAKAIRQRLEARFDCPASDRR